MKLADIFIWAVAVLVIVRIASVMIKIGLCLLALYCAVRWLNELID